MQKRTKKINFFKKKQTFALGLRKKEQKENQKESLYHKKTVKKRKKNKLSLKNGLIDEPMEKKHRK